jgi:hypothetical protein
MLTRVSPISPAIANASLNACAEAGKRLNSASEPLATDSVMVRT